MMLGLKGLTNSKQPAMETQALAISSSLQLVFVFVSSFHMCHYKLHWQNGVNVFYFLYVTRM